MKLSDIHNYIFPKMYGFKDKLDYYNGFTTTHIMKNLRTPTFFL